MGSHGFMIRPAGESVFSRVPLEEDALSGYNVCLTILGLVDCNSYGIGFPDIIIECPLEYEMSINNV